ncbi:hypothetical protein EV191_109147 [Tamaricihabitans halophyticus]|uniref:Integral membrane protein n=1 Tax=Tamaricihabitans halophyticus TaxID=1262583 RepID=A0A4R2QQM2_9PSEU|nr:hypothetical protein [Tamaricihabitans halophyticus]TCP49325.1 hypothetical protein EV191_109147 [Tamaricihabitans halophyticus]
MEFVRLLLVFLHLLGMGMLFGMVFVQLKAGSAAPVNKGWLHGAGLQLITGMALMLLAPATDAEYDHMKLGIKILVVVAIAGLAVAKVRAPAAPRWFTPTLGALVVLNVGLAVFWT